MVLMVVSLDTAKLKTTNLFCLILHTPKKLWKSKGLTLTLIPNWDHTRGALSTRRVGLILSFR